MFSTIITIGAGVVLGLWLQHKKILTFPAVETFCEKTKATCKKVVNELTPAQPTPKETTIDNENDAHKN